MERPTDDTRPFATPWAMEPAGALESRDLPRGPRASRVGTIIAWLVISGAIVASFVLTSAEQESDEDGDQIGAVLMRLQGRYLVGAAQIAAQGPVLYESVSLTLDTGSLGQRIRFVVLAAELVGRDEASARLTELERLLAEEAKRREEAGAGFEPSPDDRAALDVLAKLYGPAEGPDDDAEPRAPPIEAPSGEAPPGEAPSSSAQESAEHSAGAAGGPLADRVAALDDTEREVLRRSLDWFGELALAPAGADRDARERVMATAVRTFFTLFGTACGALVLGIVGFICLLVMVVLVVTERMGFRFELRPGGPSHGIWAETYAVWLVGFLALQVAAGLVIAAVPALGFWPISAVFLLSLAALGWPVLRGVPFSEVRRQIGWTTGGNPFVEVLYGLGSYVMTLPLLAVGLIATLILLAIDQALGPVPETFAPAGSPAHPIVVELASGDVRRYLEILFLAAVAAPIVEETMFRGVLYRHLRGATASWGRGLSVVASALFASLIFGALHPQGWVAIPALAALGFGFSLAREWRESLIAPAVMHGLSNGLVLSLVGLLAGS